MTDQTTPTRRRDAARRAGPPAAAGALATIVAWAAGEFAGVQVPAGVEAAFATVVTAVTELARGRK